MFLSKSFTMVFFFLSTVFSQQFTKIESAIPANDGGDSRSVNWIDYDNDGDPDLFITNGPRLGANNMLYENNSDGTFSKIDTLIIVKDNAPSDGATWGDYNSDGHIDLFVANWYDANNLLYLNNGDKTFRLHPDTITTGGGFSESGAWADYNGDSYLDLFVANSSGDLKNFFYQNDTDESFTKISGNFISDNTDHSRHMDWADYDNDGNLDLFIANEENENNHLFNSNGDGTFSQITEGEIVNNNGASFGSSWADYDNDGDLDLFVANWNNQNNFLYNNNGDGTFTRITDGVIVNDKGFSIGTSWGDIDNDGDLDLFVANGFSSNETNNSLYLNNADGTFIKDTSSVSKDGGWSYGASFGDYNRDGYLDLAVAKCFNANENNTLFQNSGGENNWILLNLKGTVSNVSAIGAVIKTKSLINGKPVWQMRTVSGQSGYCGQNLELHFGLADASLIDSMIIKWPSGQTETFENVAVNQVKTIIEDIPQGFLRLNFKAEKTLNFGKDPVSFVDISITNENEPIQSWEWDFDNDGIVDANGHNPIWQYDTLGVYSVKLFASNGSESQEKVFEDYIKIQARPGIVIHRVFPFSPDTVIAKREKIAFEITAEDSSNYPLRYQWQLNGVEKSTEPIYNYQASSFGVPRFDTVSVEFSNGFEEIKYLWSIDVQHEVTSISAISKLPMGSELFQNYPNPFNPSTTISYSLAKASDLEIMIFSSTGRVIKKIRKKQQSAGIHSFRFNPTNLASGILYYRINTAGFQKTIKMIYLK